MNLMPIYTSSWLLSKWPSVYMTVCVRVGFARGLDVLWGGRRRTWPYHVSAKIFCGRGADAGLFEENIKEKYQHVQFRSSPRLNFHILALALVYQDFLNIKNSLTRASKLIPFNSLIKSKC